MTEQEQIKEALEILGRQVALMRKSLKLSQEELSEKSGISRQSISEIETGKSNITYESLIKLSNAFGMALDVKFRLVK
ncbi:MAG: helix-turn-helix domain-containing protein [Bacteroidia bacterium]|nr:helix-turn-helix domain-containing protein [Bacteroidia bacterium]